MLSNRRGRMPEDFGLRCGVAIGDSLIGHGGK
jgi:hypothetical protein